MLEHIIYRHVMIHCEDYKILVDFQYGFRNKRFTWDTTYSNAGEYRQKQRQRMNMMNVDILILDFSKDFNPVPHAHLLKKLKSYGITVTSGARFKPA